MPGELFVVGTPIGNLGDMSPRAVETLQSCDFIAAEDTRVTVKLLNHFDIKKPMTAYHEHNRAEKGPTIIERLLAGESCALVTDAGMPAISDPGEDLVCLCHENGIKVSSVPGPSALITALALSGLSVSRFTFEGFLSMNKKSRRDRLSELANEPRTMVFYEAPHKLKATLKDLLKVLGNRNIALVREMTKIHETVLRITLEEACKKYEEDNPRGEYVLIVEGKPEQQTSEEEKGIDGVALAKELMEKGFSSSEAAKQAARQTGAKKGDIYKQLI